MERVGMQTLESMTQGTKVGTYTAFIYALTIVIASSITLFVQTDEAVKQHELNTHKVAVTYGLPEASAENLICFQGMLHYNNINPFSGALAFSPSISCSVDELTKLQDNSAEKIADVAALFLMLGLFITFFTYREIAKDSNGQKAP